MQLLQGVLAKAPSGAGTVSVLGQLCLTETHCRTTEKSIRLLACFQKYTYDNMIKSFL